MLSHSVQGAEEASEPVSTPLTAHARVVAPLIDTCASLSRELQFDTAASLFGVFTVLSQRITLRQGRKEAEDWRDEAMKEAQAKQAAVS